MTLTSKASGTVVVAYLKKEAALDIWAGFGRNNHEFGVI
jgi:hypothetical protein